MRTTKLIATLLVAGLTVAACKQDPDYVLPGITLSTTTLDFSTDSEQSLELLATRDWQVLGRPEWVTEIRPSSGAGSNEPQRVKISVDPNNGYNRDGEIVFTIGLAKGTLALKQPGAKGEIPVGSGTLEDPYTVTGVLRYIATLESDVESPNDVYVKGSIATVTEPFSTQYGNATFVMLSDSGESFTFYRGMYLGNRKWTANDTQIKEGDEVIICGKVLNFKGNTPETQQNKAFVYMLNDVTEGSGGGGGGESGTPSGSGTQADPYNVAGARAAVANLTWTSNDDYESTDDVYVKGKISKIADNGTYGESGTYGNASFYIKDEGSDAEFYVFRALYLGNKKYTSGTDIKLDDEVVICGKLMNYRGNTPETVAGKAYLYSLNGTGEGGSEGGGGGETPAGEIKTVTVAEFIAAAPSETQKYQLTGKVSGSLNTQFGNFDLVDDTGSVYVYGLTKTDLGYGASNDKSFASLGIKEGDTVTLIGYRYTYTKEGQDDKIEVMYAYYVSHTSGSGEDSGNTPGGSEVTGTAYSKVTSITSGQKYVMVGKKEDKFYAATPLGADKTYGRLNGKEITVSGDEISADLAENEFLFTSVEGGYTIAMPDGRLLGVDTEHDGTFQIGDSYDHTFTAEVTDGLFKIVHKSTGKTIYHGGGTYTNFSCASTVPDDGTFLQLYTKSAK